MNWDDAKYFCEIAKCHSLRGAARALKVDQATVGRRLNALEHQLGQKLFHRTTKALSLTEFGASLLPDITAIDKQFALIQRKSDSATNAMTGSVTIATTDTLAHFFLIPAIQRIQSLNPQLTIKLKTGVAITDIGSLEADIAIRGQRPSDNDLVVRKLATITMGLYASPELAANHSLNSLDDVRSFNQLIMFHQQAVPRHWHQVFDGTIDASQVVMECDSQHAIIEGVRASLGIGLISNFMVPDNDPSLVKLIPEFNDYVDIWLVLHPDLTHTPKYRLVIDEIVNQFTSFYES
ncbi:MAG: LysR family transcriptional regulator [Vibrio sp.]